MSASAYYLQTTIQSELQTSFVWVDVTKSPNQEQALCFWSMQVLPVTKHNVLDVGCVCVCRNKAGWLDSELTMFTQQYLHQGR